MQNPLQLVEVGLVASSDKNAIGREVRLDTSDAGWDLWYAACYLGPGDCYGETCKRNEVPNYFKLPNDNHILLSQGYWEIKVLCVPHGETALTRSKWMGGTTGAIYINLNTTKLVFHINETSQGLPGKLIVDTRMASDLADDDIAIQCDVSTISLQGFNPIQDPTLVLVGATQDAPVDNRVSYINTKENLAPGMYFLTLTVSKGANTLFVDQIAFQIQAGFDTLVTATVDTVNTPPTGGNKPTAGDSETPSGTGWIERKDKDNTPLSGGGVNGSNSNKPYFYENYKEFENGYEPSGSGEETTKVGNLSNMESEVIYAITGNAWDSPVLPHSQTPEGQGNRFDQDRITLAPATGSGTSRYGIDLNGHTLQLEHSDSTNADENMTFITVGANQSFTLFNNGSADAQIFGASMETNAGAQKNRYDATIVVKDGGGFCCAPPDYGANSLTISGPFVSNTAWSTDENGNYHSYMKQGAMNIEGTGGVIWLNTENVLVGEGGAQNVGYTATHTVKGITTYEEESGYTSLVDGAVVDIDVTNGARINVTGDPNDNTHAATDIGYEDVHENTGGVDFPAAIFVTGKKKEINPLTGQHLSTNMTVNVN
ncbi:MAG: hypothetical protein KBS81_05140, partial [Spirochaetales bacterium]|nr:hypothetical protein [Candidatus Physcosoma equi]